HPLDLHSFPTRRSSDLPVGGMAVAVAPDAVGDIEAGAGADVAADVEQPGRIGYVAADADVAAVLERHARRRARVDEPQVVREERSEEHTSELQSLAYLV